MLALRHIALARGGVAEIARRSQLTREATYRMLSESGNPVGVDHLRHGETVTRWTGTHQCRQCNH